MDMDVVCEDIVDEVLVRLPDCRRAIQLSTVCKRWSSVINSTDFKHRFNDHVKSKKRECMQFTVIFRNQDPDRLVWEEKCLEFLPWKKVYVRASGGGLLAAAIDKKSCKICICNPMTKQWSLLPPVPESSQLCHTVGLACNSDNTHFKLVHVTRVANEQFHTNVFCSESRAWIESYTPFPSQNEEEYVSIYSFRYTTALSIATALYWIIGHRRSSLLLAHDPFEQWVRLIELPRRIVIFKLRIGNVLGRLRISQMYWKSEERVNSLRVWELEDDKTHWRLVHRVKPTSFRRKKASVFGFHPNDGDKLFLTFNRSDICLYDIKHDTFQIIGQISDNVTDVDIRYYVQAFILLHPSSMPCPVPQFVIPSKRKAPLPDIESEETKKMKIT